MQIVDSELNLAGENATFLLPMWSSSYLSLFTIPWKNRSSPIAEEEKVDSYEIGYELSALNGR